MLGPASDAPAGAPVPCTDGVPRWVLTAAEVLNGRGRCLLSGMRLGAAGIATFVAACKSGGLPHSSWLYLTANLINDACLTPLISLLSDGLWPQDLRNLNLSHNQIGDAGIVALAAACNNAGVLPCLRVFILNGNRYGNAGAAALASALRGGTWPKLADLHVNRSVKPHSELKAACATRKTLAGSPCQHPKCHRQRGPVASHPKGRGTCSWEP